MESFNTSASQPANTPRTLYKYFSLYDLNNPPSDDKRYGIAVLNKGQFYFSHADDFNDPFDVNWHLDYDASFETKLSWAEDFLNTTQPYLPPSKRRDIARSKMRDREKEADHIPRAREEFLRMTKDRFGILSLSGKHNEVLMWSHYANAHSGVCVGIDTHKLESIQHRHARMHSVVLDLYEVAYEREMPHINFFDDFSTNTVGVLLSILTTKFERWEYEDEYRLIHYEGARVPYTFGIELIREVYLGCRIEEQHKSEVLEIIEDQRRPDVKVWQAKKHPTRFKLEFEQLL